MSVTKASRPPARAALVKNVVAALDDMKAINVKVLDVRKVTDVADCMVLASGNSDRHVRSIADRVMERAKGAGFRAIGVEGARDGEWVLVDLNDVIVHVMLPRVREFYGLEELWEPPPAAVKPRAKVKAKAKAKAKVAASGRAASKKSAKRPVARGKSAAKPAARAGTAARARAAAPTRPRAKTAPASARRAPAAPRARAAKGKSRSRA